MTKLNLKLVEEEDEKQGTDVKYLSISEPKEEKHIRFIQRSVEELKLVEKKLEYIADIYDTSQSENINDLFSTAIVGCSRVTNRLRKLVLDTGNIKDLDLFENIELSGREEEGILHIRIPELPPKRALASDKTFYDEVQYIYYKAFKKFFKNVEYEVNSEKVIVAFYFNYTSDSKLKDHDNFELKGIIDILTAYILPDDNPKWCSHFYDYRIGEEECTDIFVIPESKFIDFLTKKTC